MHALIPQLIQTQYELGHTTGAFEAAALFTDISGFTSLTEALMQYEKVGAEVMADTLHEVFDPIVGEVHARGGIIPLFAGDAFAALFPVDREDPQAAYLDALATACFIRASLSPAGADRICTTKYGVFSIGVKVGLSGGRVRWGIPCSGERATFYFRGPALDGCARSESHAQRGEIVIDQTLPPQVRRHVTLAPIANGTHQRVTACSLQPRSVALPAPIFTREQLAPFFSDRILDAPLTGEFRDVAPVFLSFMEPEPVTELHTFVEAVMRYVDRCGGYLAQVAFGDKGAMLVILFGAPVAHERSVERATEFLLGLRREAGSVVWRAGYTFGKVWAGIGGGVHRREYGAVGDIMNLAARLATRADWREVWAGGEVPQRIERTHRLKPLGALRVKGKRTASAAYILLGPKEILETRIFSGAMIGRDAELATLREFVQPILAARFAGIASIHGQAGMGKSRLAFELRRRLEQRHRLQWFTCPADQILQRPMEPFRHFLRQHFSQSNTRSPDQNKTNFERILDELILALRAPGRERELAAELQRTRSCLGALIDLAWEGSLYEQLEPKLRVENTRTALKTLFKAESLRSPLVIEIEDLHWLDADSIEFLGFLARAVADHPIAVLCTSRYTDEGERFELEVDEDVPRAAVDLGILPPEAIAALAQQSLGRVPGADLTAYLSARTGGNPFFVEQLALDLRERRLLREDEQGRVDLLEREIVEVPTSINTVLMARLDRLAADTREVVQTAAVLGREFELAVLAKMVAPGSDIAAGAEDAATRGVWSTVSGTRYVFNHALMRDAAYDMQSRTRLHALHARAGGAIEELYAADLSPYYADLAYQFGHAGAVAPERKYARLAGEQAMTACDFRGATPFLQRTLALLNEDCDNARSQILKRIGTCHFTLGDYAAAEESFSQSQAAAQSAGDQVAAIVAREGLADVALKQGHYETALAIGEQNLEAYETLGNRRGVASSLHRLAIVHQRHGDIARSRDCSERGLAIHRELGDPRGIASDLNALGDIEYRSGNYRRAAEFFTQSLAACRKTQDRVALATALSNLANSVMELGEAAQAGEYYQEGLKIRREIGEKHGIAASLNNLAYLPFARGDYAEAGRYVEESLHVAREIGNPHIIAMNLNNLGLFAGLQGNHADAQAYFGESLALARRIGEPWGIAHALCGLVHTEVKLGDHAGAREHIREALRLGQEISAAAVVLEALAGQAELYYEEQKPLPSAELVGLVEAHAATEQDVKQTVLEPLREALRSVLSAEELGGAERRGALQDLDAVVARLLEA